MAEPTHNTGKPPIYPITDDPELNKKLQDLQANDKAETSAQDGAFYRVFQPDAATSPVEDTSYFRLGSYNTSSSIGSEENLVTGLGTTFSVAKKEFPGAEKLADDADTSVKNGGDVDPAKRFSTATQATDKISLTRPKVTVDGLSEDLERKSRNNGILLYTNHDLQENVLGAALMKYGKGHHVEVSDYDSKYIVKQGALTLGARTGVVISAGRLDPEDVTAPSANIEIIAQGYIKQHAYGSLEETTYGDTTKHTHGHVTDWVVGTKTSRIHGADTSMKMGASTSLVFGQDTSVRLATRLSMSAGAELNLYLSYVRNIFRGRKNDLVIGSEFKVVTQQSSKITLYDYKKVFNDSKDVAYDYKIVGALDYKRALVSYSAVHKEYKRSIVINLDAESQSIAAGIAQLKAQFENRTTALTYNASDLSVFK